MPKMKRSTPQEAEQAQRILDEQRDKVERVRNGEEPRRPGIRGKAAGPAPAEGDDRDR